MGHAFRRPIHGLLLPAIVEDHPVSQLFMGLHPLHLAAPVKPVRKDLIGDPLPEPSWSGIGGIVYGDLPGAWRAIIKTARPAIALLYPIVTAAAILFQDEIIPDQPGILRYKLKGNAASSIFPFQ